MKEKKDTTLVTSDVLSFSLHLSGWKTLPPF